MNIKKLKYLKIMLKFGIFFTLLISSFSCSIDEKSNNLQLTMLGQSLIRFDPRIYIEEPSKNVVGYLMNSDLVFTNLEVTICPDSNLCKPTRVGDYNSAVVQPDVLDYLKSININLLSLANNHSWDFGDYGILNTIKEVDKRGIVFAGTGRNLDEASSPSYITVKGKKIALIATSSSSKFRDLAVATDTKPGVNVVDMSSEEDKNRE